MLIVGYVGFVEEKDFFTDEDGVYKEIVFNDNEESNNGLSVVLTSRDEKKLHQEFEHLKDKKIRITIETC